MEQKTFHQDYTMYSEEDHGTWSLLCDRRDAICKNDISGEYLKGIHLLSIDTRRIVRIAELSEKLDALSGWTLIPVAGLIPNKDFFYMLISKKYPITVPIRKRHEMDFSELPDIFHDIWGHLPLLINEKFTRFLTSFSSIALKYVHNDKAIDFLSRLYWFTYEMGLIREEDGCKPYGGAIITSAGELANIGSPLIPKYDFDIQHIFQTPYDSLKLQKEYFIIDSFDTLFGCIDTLEDNLRKCLLFAHGEVAASVR